MILGYRNYLRVTNINTSQRRVLRVMSCEYLVSLGFCGVLSPRKGAGYEDGGVYTARLSVRV